MKYYIALIIILLTAGITFAQNTVHFIVSEESGEALIGVNIVVHGTVKGTITNTEGKASLTNLPNGAIEIRVSFLGFEESEISLNFPQDNNKTFEIRLEEGVEELTEVMISTTRSSRTIEDIPTRIEVITAEELGEKAAMNSSNIGMLLSETTGVRMQQTSLNSGNLSIRIQGLDGRYTQILKDGFPIYSGFAGGLSIMQIPPLDLKQVELIKGSNSTLYGGGAIAGLVNLITIKPEEKPELNIMMDQTSALGTTGNLFYAQKYGKTGLTVYGSTHYQKAYDPDNDGFSNMPKSQSLSLNPKFYVFLRPKTKLSLGLNASRDNRTGGDMEVIKGDTNDKHRFLEENSSNRYSAFLNFSNSTDKSIFSIKNSFSYFNRKLQIPDYTFAGDQLSSFSEILLNLHGNEKSDWQVGANYYTENFSEDKSDSLPVRDYTNNTIGGFIQNTTNFNSFITLEGGFRTDYDFEHGAFFLPRVSILLKPARKITSRIGGAFGYKLPTIFTEEAEKIYFEGITPIDASNMKPEKSVGINFDVHYKTSFLQKFTFSINQLFFFTRLKNSLVLLEDSAQNRYVYENASGDILSSGFETNIKLTYKDFKLYINYAFVNTDLKYENINKQKPLTPKHSAGFVLFYEVEEKWSAGYELYYTGSQYDEMYDKKPDYWVMGVMLMRMFERLSIYVNFENFSNTIQTNYEPLVLPPLNNPTFPDIWAPSDGFVFNAGLKIKIL